MSLCFVLVVFGLSSCVIVNGAFDWCPQYHLIRGQNIYDPSGPIYYNNLWHVFEDSCSWCHYYSPDLLHWKLLNSTGFTSLTGSTEGVTTTNGIPEFRAYYPNLNNTAIMRSISTDNMLQNWYNTTLITKRPSNIINGSTNYRDPTRPLQINGDKYMGVGSGVAPNGPGLILWYKALNDDLTEWQLLGPLFNVTQTLGLVNLTTMMYDANDSQNIQTIECPDVFLMDNKYVVIASMGSTKQWNNYGFCTNEYWVGDIDLKNNIFNFSPTNHALLDYGNLYAAKTGTMAMGVNGLDRRILFAFTSWSHSTGPSACGRSHVIPRDLTLNNNNMLNINPIAEIESIRGESNAVTMGSELQLILNCELLHAQLPKTGNLSINILVSRDGAEYLQIGYSFDNDGNFYVDHRKCCADNNDIIQTVAFNSNQVLIENGLYLNILLDRSVIESYFLINRK